MTVQEIFAEASKLSLEDKRLLNKLLVENLNRSIKVQSMLLSSNFKVGDEVTFEGRTTGLIKMRVDGFSRDRSKIKGTQLGGFRPGCMWTVAASLCKAA